MPDAGWCICDSAGLSQKERKAARRGRILKPPLSCSIPLLPSSPHTLTLTHSSSSALQLAITHCVALPHSSLRTTHTHSSIPCYHSPFHPLSSNYRTFQSTMSNSPATPDKGSMRIMEMLQPAVPSVEKLSTTGRLKQASLQEPSPASTYGDSAVDNSTPATPQDVDLGQCNVFDPHRTQLPNFIVLCFIKCRCADIIDTYCTMAYCSSIDLWADNLKVLET